VKRISKSADEPAELAAYRDRFAKQRPLWNAFKKDSNRTGPVKDALRNDQRGLCAYCEVKLSPGNETVEHIVSRDKDHDRELDWQNLLLVCYGDEKSPPPKEFSCGHARNFAGSPEVLNPLLIPASERLFAVDGRTGELRPDLAACDRSGVPRHLVQSTLDSLGLRVSRLSRARLRVLETLEEQIARLNDGGLPFDLAERQLAGEQFSAHAEWPEFFTTLRWRLGAAAEARLAEIHFQG